MKIAQLTSWLTRKGGGIPAVVFPLADSLQEHGMDAPLYGLVELGGQLAGDYKKLEVNSFQPRISTWAPGLTKTLIDDKADLLHVHGLWDFSTLLSLEWQRKTALSYVVSPHGMLDPWALQNSAAKKRIAAMLFQRRQLRGAGCLHALNNAELSAIRAYGLDNPVAVIPNGIDLPVTDAAYAADTPPWTANIPDEARVLLNLGRIHPKKNLPALIAAWNKAKAKDWHLVIAGWDQDGHEAELKQLTVDLDVADTVHFVGAQFDQAKDAAFRRADAFVLPSLSEGQPMVVLEAWSYGLPVLMTAASNLPEGFAASAAIEVPVDAQGMAEKLMEFFRLGDQAQADIGARGKTLVTKHFSWNQVASEMAAVYRWLVKGGSAPASVDFR